MPEETNLYPDLAGPFRSLLEKLQGRQVAVLGHARPDGDCIGSQVALCRVLRSQGIEATCVNPDPVPRRLEFLVGDTPFVRAADFRTEAKVAVFVDCADHGRSGAGLREAFPEPVGNIDHHVSNTRYAQSNLIDSQSSATGEILAGLFLDTGLPIDALSAQGLYVGIATDTGQFCYPSTSRRVFELSAQLLELGASPAAATNELYERESFNKLELLGRFLESFRLECEDRVCIGFLDQKAFDDSGASDEDTEGLVDYARSIEGVDVGVLIEDRPKGIKASLRSKKPVYRVDQVAKVFSGGGHACAAGLNTDLSFDEFYPKFIRVVRELLAAVDSGVDF
ncbi:MAG: bifunctional oligoribonuclease/PAP phosphatase NrnA [Verrucomicrobia bacterium]|nr:MAG: bifunctional oligoribonuclease/PAP phosphatase NrnA [Verrucomicrobiota bacterium]